MYVGQSTSPFPETSPQFSGSSIKKSRQDDEDTKSLSKMPWNSYELTGVSLTTLWNNDVISESSYQTLWSYNAIAEVYAEKVKNYVPEKEIQEFISHLPYKAKVLDIGCGSGRDARIFCSKGFEVTGIDFSSNMIKIAKETAPLAKFHLMSIEAMYFPSHFFDGIWANCSLLHISKAKMPLALNKIYNFLSEYGIFSLTLKEGEGEGLKQDFRYENAPSKFYAYYTEDEIRSLLQDAKFSVLKVNKSFPGSYVPEPLINIFAVKFKSSL